MNKLYYNNICKIENASTEDGFLKIEGYCAHYGKPNLNDEIVDAKSFDAFFNMYKSNQITPHLTWEHTDTVIGGIDKIVSKNNGLWMSARLNNNVKIVNEMIAPNVLAGDIDRFSTEGYIMNGIDGIVENEDGSYYVKNFLLTAVSVVRTPADPAAVFTVKNFVDEWNAEHKPIRKFYWFM